MIRHLLIAAIAAGLAFGGGAALAQQSMPASPPVQSKGPAAAKSGQATSMRETGADKDRRLDSIASGLNACQLKSESERQACMDQVIRQNGG